VYSTDIRINRIEEKPVAGATEAIASFVASTSLGDLPAGAIEKSKKAIADTFAVILAGAGSEVAEPLHQYVKASGESGASPILGTGTTAGAEMAALVNGTFGHALDFDDVLSMMPAHPSAVIVAAVLASLDGRRVSGKALIEAYALGVEVGGKLGVGITNEHYQRGFHATGTLALFSALAALAKLHGLDVATARQALGIAGSMASGLRRNFGTMTKPLHTGLAARSALTALRLAVSGFTAAPDIFEAKAGFFAAYGTAASDPAVTVEGLGRPYVVADPGLALKKFPCCHACHRGMDGLLALRSELGFDAGSVEKAICRMPPGGMLVLTYPRPVTGLEGKFSMEYCIAAGVLDGRYGLASFTDDAVRRPEIQSLYSRITAVEDPACRGGDPNFDKKSSGSRGIVEVEVVLKNGRSAKTRVEVPPGHPRRELSWDDLRAKFSVCAELAKIPSERGRQAFEQLAALDRVEDLRPLVALMS
jgi:2-methylcitrate dehydratase PrpD